MFEFIAFAILFLIAFNIYFTYLLASTVYKIKSLLSNDDLIQEEMDKTIDSNIKKIATLEYEMELLKKKKIEKTKSKK